MVCRAREVMYSPGMRAPILQESANCPVCATYSSSPPKEPWNSTSPLEVVPKRPVQARRTVICYDWKPLQWLVWSWCSKRRTLLRHKSFQLHRRTSPAMVFLISFFQAMGPNMCQEFMNFARAFDFQLITWSPYYTRATGKAESAVKEAKRMRKKSDLLTVLFEIHRVRVWIPPPQHRGFFVVVSESLLHQSVPPVTVARDEHVVRRGKVKGYCDKTSSKGLSSLVPGKFVNSKHNAHHRDERWKFGEVLLH